jgi:hypothetical protein
MKTETKKVAAVLLVTGVLYLVIRSKGAKKRNAEEIYLLLGGSSNPYIKEGFKERYEKTMSVNEHNRFARFLKLYVKKDTMAPPAELEEAKVLMKKAEQINGGPLAT